MSTLGNLTHTLFDTGDFPPRWQCGNWSSALGWTHIISDLAIFGAYAAIPMLMAYFITKRRDVPFPPIFWLFICFILACGIGHFVEATIFWHPWYRLSAAVKVVTAIVSWATIVALVRALPLALQLPAMAQQNRELQTEVVQRRNVESGLRREEERVRIVLDAAPNAILMVNASGRITLVNSQTEQLFGYTRDELLGQTVEMLIPMRVRTAHPSLREGFFKTPSVRSMGAGRDLYGLRKDNREVPIEIGLNPVRTDEGDFVLASIIDITERKRNEAQRQASLDQAEMLLREVHHRVKNNMQIISSMLRLHSGKLRDPSQLSVFTDCRDRIQAMALIHERLYGARQFGRIAFDGYLADMVRMILSSTADGGNHVRLELQLDPIEIDLDTAVPLSLIAGELILNAFKHALPATRKGLLAVRLLAGDPMHTLIVQDDGPGLPPNFNPSKSSGIGFDLVESLTRQIRGKLTLGGPANGTIVTIRWPAAGSAREGAPPLAATEETATPGAL